MALHITKESIDIGLVTGNPEPMTQFYHDTLGLTVEATLDMPGGMRMVRLVCGTTIIKLVSLAKTPAASNPAGGVGGATGMRYFTITVDNLHDAVRECTEAGYANPVPEREIRPGISIAMIEDPDGNWVELLQQD